MDGLRLDLVIGAPRENLPIDERLANRQFEGGEMIRRVCMAELEATGISQIVDDPVAELLSGGVLDVNGGQHSVRPPCWLAQPILLIGFRSEA